MQAQKYGHIDFNALVEMMPEADSAQKALETYARMLEKELEAMQLELETKYNDFQTKTKAGTLSETMRATMEEDLVAMQQRIQKFQMDARNELQAKEQELFAPVMDKARKAVEEVGKEGGYIYIYNESSLLYYSEQSEDIMPKVKAKLGIQ